MSSIAYSKEYLVELPKSKGNRVVTASLNNENSFLSNTLNKEFKFTFTIGASDNKGECLTEHKTVEKELLRDWQGQTVFCNLSAFQECNRWVTKCYEESKKLNTLVVMIMPIADNNPYFRDIVYNKARQIRFVRSEYNIFEAVVVVL